MSSVNATSAAVMVTPLPQGSEAAPSSSSATLPNNSKAASEPMQAAAAEPVDKQQLQNAVDVINQAVELDQRGLSFTIDDLSGRSIIKVRDLATDELIRQIPSEEILKVAQDIKRLQEEMGQSIGLLIDKRV
ncbi:flagellar protein FlaG [Alkalimonas sp.]|uniref:flagellar protein FlaG n=1 Tax=Alkalimonas sp. TaxID=1872453 RepID=UPI00263A5557|nr:flagellar protein FlaG [Alkalimonas sp.]MCC5824976.1 flagellar protein FlaG [Alkalimonas sp.]